MDWTPHWRTPQQVSAAQVLPGADLAGEFDTLVDVSNDNSMDGVMAFLPTRNGMEPVYMGDWIVKFSDGSVEVHNVRDFYEHFEYFPENTIWFPFNSVWLPVNSEGAEEPAAGEDEPDGSPTEPPAENGNDATEPGSASSNGEDPSEPAPSEVAP